MKRSLCFTVCETILAGLGFELCPRVQVRFRFSPKIETAACLLTCVADGVVSMISGDFSPPNQTGFTANRLHRSLPM